ncbi:MAG: PAS domain S-box protein [bacterium]|nr:PAS domain S-box protein [bacterium]
MKKDNSTNNLQIKIDLLEAEFAEARDTIRAIQAGEIDALVTSDEQIYTLKGADHIYRVLIESMHEGALTLMPDGTILYCNGFFAQLLRMPLEQIIGSSIQSYIIPKEQVKFDRLLKKPTKNSASSREIHLKVSDANIIPVLLSLTLIQIDKGTNIISMTVTDLTEQKQSEKVAATELLTRERLKHEQDLRKQFEESEEKFRTLADNIPNMVWMANADGYIFWYNNRWYEYTGTTPEQMEGWGWQSTHDPEVLPTVLKKWKSSIEQEELFEMVFPLKGRDGIFRPFLTRIVPILDERGNLIQWFGTNTDITKIKGLEKQKDDFIGIASHELKTPVTSVKAYTQILQARFIKSDDMKSAEFVGKMDAQLDKLTSLITDLLDVTKIEGGGITIS